MTIRDDRPAPTSNTTPTRWPAVLRDGQRLTRTSCARPASATPARWKAGAPRWATTSRTGSLHLAREPYQNFSSVTATRLTVGLRF